MTLKAVFARIWDYLKTRMPAGRLDFQDVRAREVGGLGKVLAGNDQIKEYRYVFW